MNDDSKKVLAIHFEPTSYNFFLVLEGELGETKISCSGVMWRVADDTKETTVSFEPERKIDKIAQCATIVGPRSQINRLLAGVGYSVPDAIESAPDDAHKGHSLVKIGNETLL